MSIRIEHVDRRDSLGFRRLRASDYSTTSMRWKLKVRPSNLHTKESQFVGRWIEQRNAFLSSAVERAGIDPANLPNALVAANVRVTGDEIIVALFTGDAFQTVGIVAVGDGEAFAFDGELAKFVEALHTDG